MKSMLALILIIAALSCNGQSVDARIREIRSEFSQINANKSYAIDSLSISGGSTADACVHLYKDSAGNIRKMVAMYYGETGKVVEEFYIKNGKVFFAFTQTYHYNRPIYWDEASAREAGDDQVFDIQKSTIDENRCYFDCQENLIQQIDANKAVIRDKNKLAQVQSMIIKEFKLLNSSK